ncbi:MAG: hypothetical protein RRA35_01590 [Desulfomonilia bacterium]|nr:hypothetical protein [Desulfomonilia bacterium]
MKLRVFLIVCLSSLLILAGSFAVVFMQLQQMRSINLNPLTEHLVQQNTEVLTWILSVLSPEQINEMDLPRSWAEIMVVSSDDLKISASTHTPHVGQYMYELPEVLDQAHSIMAALKAGRSKPIATKDYLLVFSPVHEEAYIIAVKPGMWEEDLVSTQDQQISQNIDSMMRFLLIYLLAGVFIIFGAGVFISRVVTSPLTQSFEALEELSLGNFEREFPEAPSREMKQLGASFLRLKLSLKMALERLGGA